MPWKGVTVHEQRQNFIRDYRLTIYSVTELAQRFSISRKTAYKWIHRWERHGEDGLQEEPRTPHSCPWATSDTVRDEVIRLRTVHPRWGPRKLLALIERAHPDWNLPAVSTVARILSKAGLVKPTRRGRKPKHPGCPKHRPEIPNDIWAADYKGQFRLKNGSYCFPLTVSDLFSRYILGVQSHPAVSLEQSQAFFTHLFRTYGLPGRIRTDNGAPFASSALARLSQLSVWFISLGIYPELIEPGRPQQNGIHERMHSTLKRETAMPPAGSMTAQQRRFDAFRDEFNQIRPHEGIDMARPADLYRRSPRSMPKRFTTYDYPAHYLVRRVSRAGTIRVLNRQFFLSSTLKEHYVGLEEVDTGIFDIYFCFYQIGRYDVEQNVVEDIISRVPDGYAHPLERPKVLPMS